MIQDDLDPIEKSDEEEDEMSAAGMHVVGDAESDEDDDDGDVVVKPVDDEDPIDGLAALDKAVDDMEVIPIDIGEEEDI